MSIAEGGRPDTDEHRYELGAGAHKAASGIALTHSGRHMHKLIFHKLMVPASAISLALAVAATPVMADPPQRGNVWQGNPRDNQAPRETPRQQGPKRGTRENTRRGNEQWGGSHGEYRHPVINDGRVYAPSRRTRVYRHTLIVRPYGHWYNGYGFHRDDDDALKWLAFTAITMAIINQLSEQQERTYENAQIQATTAPVGQTIHWNDGNVSGTVTATRDGTSSDGRYCREFQQTVTIGSKSEQADGTACQQPDGTGR